MMPGQYHPVLNWNAVCFRICTTSRTTVCASCLLRSRTSKSSIRSATSTRRAWSVCGCSTRSSLTSMRSDPPLSLKDEALSPWRSVEINRPWPHRVSVCPCSRSYYPSQNSAAWRRSKQLAAPTWLPLGSVEAQDKRTRYMCDPGHMEGGSGLRSVKIPITRRTFFPIWVFRINPMVGLSIVVLQYNLKFCVMKYVLKVCSQLQNYWHPS